MLCSVITLNAIPLGRARRSFMRRLGLPGGGRDPVFSTEIKRI